MANKAESPRRLKKAEREPVRRTFVRFPGRCSAAFQALRGRAVSIGRWCRSAARRLLALPARFRGRTRRVTRLGGLLAAYQRRDPAARSRLEIFLLYPGVHAVLWHRLAHWLYAHRARFLARCVSQWARFWTGIEIHPGASLGHRLVIDHGAGVVIGETTEIGDDCLIYQGVTLGGTGKEKGKRHPTLGNNVLVGCGAKILGPFRVGDNARIAAGAVVLREVPPNATAVGVPAQIVRVEGKPVYYADNVDLTSVENPTWERIEALTARIAALEQRLQASQDADSKAE